MAVRMRFRERNWKMEISLVRSIRGARENTIFSIGYAAGLMVEDV